MRSADTDPPSPERGRRRSSVPAGGLAGFVVGAVAVVALGFGSSPVSASASPAAVKGGGRDVVDMSRPEAAGTAVGGAAAWAGAAAGRDGPPDRPASGTADRPAPAEGEVPVLGRAGGLTRFETALLCVAGGATLGMAGLLVLRRRTGR